MPLIIELAFKIFLLMLQNIKALDLLQLIFGETYQVVQQAARLCDVSDIGLLVGLEELHESVVGVRSQMQIELIFWLLLRSFISEHVVRDCDLANIGFFYLGVNDFWDTLILNGHLSIIETDFNILVQNKLIIVVK